MLYLRRSQHHVLCVLNVSTSVLDQPGIVVTDGNAASGYARFSAGPDGLSIVDESRTFAEYWTDQDEIEYLRKKTAKCAEVLVPDRVDPHFIEGAYVSCHVSLEAFQQLVTGLTAIVDGNLFFQ